MPLIPYAWWRRLHYSTFAVFVMALAHGLGSGTDTGTPWALALYGATGALVFLLTARRALVGRSRGLIPPPLDVPRRQAIPKPVSSRPVDLA